MAKVLVFTESADGKLKKGSLELLTAASSAGNEVCALALGSDAKNVSEQAGHYGASEVFICASDLLDNYNPEIFKSIICDAVDKSGANVILASASSLSRDVFPAVAAKIEAGIAHDCVELSFSGDEVSATKPLYSGKCTAKVSFQNCTTKIVLMRANQLPVGEADTSKSTTITELAAPTVDLKTLIKEIVKGTSKKLDLTEANIIVSGGRGMKDAEGFTTLLEPLADTLNATLGASRAIVDAGWVSHNMQVGQTGKTVAPSLYIACGISGAIQHLAGMSGSKVIVAINKDPEAPIFKKATYGIVGDVFDVVPKLTEAFKEIL